jgi:nitroreductase
LAAPLAAADAVKLPAPRKSGGPDVLAAIETRASGSSFSGAVSDEELATVLWAATGRNRDGGGWTIPMAMGKPPYCDIYVAGKNSAHLYDRENHALIPAASGDLRSKIAKQDIAKNAYYSLVVVMDGAAAKAIRKDTWEQIAGFAVGAATQNIYLACEALGLKTRFIISVNPDVARKELALHDGDVVACIMALGK